MKELLKLAVEKGFKTKTLTTRWTLDGKLGLNKSDTFLVNELCEYLLLCEIQKWLREKYDIIVNIVPYEDEIPECEGGIRQTLWEDEIIDCREIPWLRDITTHTYYHSNEEALLAGIKEALKLIKNDN